MTPEAVMTLAQQAMQMTLMIAAPMLLTALLIGLLVSIFQAATQINEATLSFIPKLLAMFLVLMLTGSWIIGSMVDYVQRLFGNIPWMIG